MQYLANRGSSIQVLAFSPTNTPGVEEDHGDAVGHVFPNYHYVRGQATIQLAKNQTLKQVIAHPVRKEDITRYHDACRVLDDMQDRPSNTSWEE